MWDEWLTVDDFTLKGGLVGRNPLQNWPPTVDGRNPANQLRLVVYPIIYKVLYIPGGARFLPSAVV